MLLDFQRLMLPRDEADGEPPPEGKPAPAALAMGGSGSETEAVSAFRQAQAGLINELLEHIHAQPPVFFEELVIDVLLAAGYGARRRDLAQRLGRSGDGGIDGLIAQDELGLDLIYIQAKRFRPGNVVPVSDVRDFVGSLDAHHAAKGAFVTTSHFSPSTVSFCEQVSRRVVLIDGKRLAELMIRFNIGVTVVESYQIKRIDAGYFTPDSARRTLAMTSASSQPRK